MEEIRVGRTAAHLGELMNEGLELAFEAQLDERDAEAIVTLLAAMVTAQVHTVALLEALAKNAGIVISNDLD